MLLNVKPILSWCGENVDYMKSLLQVPQTWNVTIILNNKINSNKFEMRAFLSGGNSGNVISGGKN